MKLDMTVKATGKDSKREVLTYELAERADATTPSLGDSIQHQKYVQDRTYTEKRMAGFIDLQGADTSSFNATATIDQSVC